MKNSDLRLVIENLKLLRVNHTGLLRFAGYELRVNGNQYSVYVNLLKLICLVYNNYNLSSHFEKKTS